MPESDVGLLVLVDRDSRSGKIAESRAEARSFGEVRECIVVLRRSLEAARIATMRSTSFADATV